MTYDTEPGAVRFVHEGDSLSLHHPLIAAEWRWNDAGRIDATRFDHLASGTSWLTTEPPEPLYQLGVDGYGGNVHHFGPNRPVSAGRIVSVQVNTAEPRGCTGASISFDLSAATPGPYSYDKTWRAAPVTVTWHIQAHPDHPVIRQWFDVTNTGEEPVTITRLPLLLVTLAGPPARLTAYSGLDRRQRLRQGEGSDWLIWQMLPLGPGVTGSFESGYRRTATWLGLTTSAGPGLFAGWESNAAVHCDYGDLHGMGDCGIDLWLEPDYRLEPGATLTGPAAFLGAADGDLDETSYRTHRFVEDVVALPMPDDERFPYVAFNSWGYGDRIDDASMRQCFEVCRKLGIELFVVDFGWEDPDWYARTDLFPHGLAPLADAAHEAGMHFGIHLSFGNASSLSRMYQEHPEWANGAGMWAYLSEGVVLRVTLGNPDARDWMTKRIIEIIDETKIDHFLTDHFLWGPTNPEVQDRHATDDYLTISEGFDLVMQRVHAARPHVLLEHCDNGIGLPTFGMVAQHHTSIGADAQGTQLERVATWRISRVLPPRYLDHYVTEQLKPGTRFEAPFGDYEYRSQIFGGPMILMTDIMALEEGGADWNALLRAIDLVKRIRRRVIDGKVLHLLEPQPVEQVGKAWDGWDALGSYHEPSDTAVILVFRLGGNLEERTIPVHGINPDTTYRISYEDRDDTQERTGADIMATGIPLTLPGPGLPRVVDGLGYVRASEVIHLTPVA